MNDLKYIRENIEAVTENLLNQNFALDKLDELLKVDDQRRELLTKVEGLRQKLNSNQGNNPPSPDSIEELKKVSQEEKKLKLELSIIEEKWHILQQALPNLTGKSTPKGKSEADNTIIQIFNEPDKKSGPSHEEIMKNLDLVDIERAAKVSGSRFYYLKNEAVELEFALIRFVIEEAKKAGYQLIIPPVLMKRGLGLLAGHPEVATEDAYHTQEDDLYLIGSSEHSIMAMHSGEVLDVKQLPKKYLGFSTCFRREAGSYGKDVKGILRTHQFDKLELVVIAKPEESEAEFTRILDFETNLMKQLDLPFRTVEICSGDIGHAASRQVDIETWIPSQEKYRETHSCSNCTAYQTRGLKIKFRDESGKPVLAHALNATAFAIGRILIAIVENNHTNDSIKIPEVLVKYLDFFEIKKS